ncbi:unnamed protein product [Didymodactylos carnosus]|uniref:Uncharacterized protein n=1 Tax=Didymodactylos carnosus TaxID=1234261 RepID=A0A815ZFC8_9BILA|nr:unnamed protein product [Didymodactylos carnosus]CAF1582073.1 unnamed protein product [Didymodactylos carnosus]CAF3893757.1 unnamed protein product [Didymodactylos carnosus]CAF4450146.1 unnamed protein product [Didymodactylos carnosus]
MVIKPKIHADRRKRYDLKVKLKRLSLTTFDKKYKKKRAKVKASYCQKQKELMEASAAASSLAVPATPSAKDLRKLEGAKRRRSNTGQLKNENP